METLFAELKRYVGRSADYEVTLDDLRPSASPPFERIAHPFYARIQQCDEAQDGRLATCGQLIGSFAREQRDTLVVMESSAPDGAMRSSGCVIADLDRPLQDVGFAASGPGVDTHTQRRLFEPLATTRPHGIGLGLALPVGEANS